MLFTWIEQEQELGAAALTVRAQAVSPNDNGRLLWDIFFPRQDVGSVRLNAVLTATEQRYTADRREWNQGGRLIPFATPGIEELEMVPIESYFELGEYEIQRLTEQTLGNQDVFRQQVRMDVPGRINALTLANYRRIEVDAFTAWALGTVTVRNPQNNSVDTFTFPIESGRRQTAGTAWNVAANAYTAFRDWYRDAVDANGGSGQGVMLRQAVLNEILADAPAVAFNPGGTGITPTREQVRQRLQDELGGPFQFYVNERTVRTFGDPGTTNTTQTKLWPQGIVAVVPTGERVGATAFAPVARAFDVARSVPDARIDVNGMAVFPEVRNNGRSLHVDVQGNALSVPDQQLVQTINSGIT